MKKKIDKKLYNLYLNVEYIFKFSYYFKWKADLDRVYIPKYKKYKKLFISIILDKTSIIKKKLYIYWLYFLNIKRHIFWLYFKEIYLDLVWTSVCNYMYFFFILTPMNIFLILKYNIKRKNLIRGYNNLEWDHIKKVFYRYFYLIIILILLYWGLNVIFIWSLLIYIIFKYIFEYFFSFFWYNIKLYFFSWNNFLKLSMYKAQRLILDLEFQYETLFLFVYMHVEHDIILSYKLVYSTIKGYYKYYYFNWFYYKLYLFLGYKNLINIFIKFL